VFGVPLSVVESDSNGIPIFLKYATEAIEALGPYFYGLYCLMATDCLIADFCSQIETNLEQVNFIDMKGDIQIAPTMVTKFLANLPEPFMLFTPEDRLLYRTSDKKGKLAIWMSKIKELSPQKRAVLEFLLRHWKWLATLPYEGATEFWEFGMKLTPLLIKQEEIEVTKKFGVFKTQSRRFGPVTDYYLLHDLIENVELVFCPQSTPPTMAIGKPRRTLSDKFYCPVPTNFHHARSISAFPCLLFENENDPDCRTNATRETERISRVSSVRTQTVTNELDSNAMSTQVSGEISQLALCNTEVDVKESIPDCASHTRQLTL
jgi:hypothetical protein